MVLYVLDQNFDKKDTIDEYISIIWTDRYAEAGDFELCLSASSENLNKFSLNDYLYREDSEHVMIVETIKIDTNSESGNIIVISGRSLESILDRRVAWPQITLDGYLESQIEALFNYNILFPDPSMYDSRSNYKQYYDLFHDTRCIPNFIYEYSNDGNINELKITAQYTGDNLYDIIKAICEDCGIGFKIILRDKQFVFSFYNGIDRSYNQNINSYIEFMPSLDNVITTSYKDTIEIYRNVCFVAGEDSGDKRRWIAQNDKNYIGLSRRELYVDARDLQSEKEDGTQMSDDEYTQLLVNRADTDLSDYVESKTFEGEVEDSVMYRYGEHYYIGDIIQIENEYGVKARSRITEYTFNDEESSTSSYPTFKLL